MKVLYHTRPIGILNKIIETDHVFIEIDPLLKSKEYLNYFLKGCSSPFTILDCGVGVSPNLLDPTGHTSKDPHWAIRWLDIVLRIKPSVIVIPDLLGDAVGTRENYQRYTYVLSFMDVPLPSFMYVIQGKNIKEAKEEVEFACCEHSIGWIGIPRIVHYYQDCLEESFNRLSFVEDICNQVRSAGKNIHLLGLNNIEELKWASVRHISIDTRLASLASVNNFNVTEKRPPNINIELTETFTSEIHSSILKNIETLDKVYYGVH